MNSFSLAWEKPDGFPHQMILDYHVRVELLWSFDKTLRTLSPKEQKISELSAKVFGLRAGTKYNVSVLAASERGRGVAIYKIFWTEVGGTYRRKEGRILVGRHFPTNMASMHFVMGCPNARAGV